MDKKKQLSVQLIFDDSVKKHWGIRRYKVGTCESRFTVTAL
jgi:hypothetical protein